MSAVDLGTAPLSRLFWRYVTPTVAAMLITGIYVTIDGIFVGHVLGQDGMAGLMLAYPICAVLYAVGALIGMGASSLVSFYLGQGNPAKARHIVGNALVMVLLASALLSFIGIRYGEPMLAWMGAEGEIFTAGLSYLQAYAWLGVFAVLSMAFSSLLRNDGRPGFVTLIMVVGGLLNVLLDYLLMVVFPFGLAGVATATMLSQAVTGLACLWHFFTPRSQLRISWDTLRPELRLMGETVRLGISSFLMYLYLSVVLALHNKALLAVGTSLHVAAYGVISYTEAFFYLVFEGIAMGIQPIASFNAGAGHWRRVLRIRNLALGVTLGIALCAMFPLYLWPEAAVYLFAGDNATLLPVASLGIWLYFWGLPMEGLLLVGATYFQAINRARIASLLTGGKLVLIGGFLWGFSTLWGVPGVWLALPTCSSLLVLVMWRAMRRESGAHALAG
ncbi:MULTISPECIES: MATE family efflux transporter [Aeromonas]|uniref:Multidrug export protein MepA n=2 Tax=Aeromonas veronii TaxID=654 RepID=A0A2T4N1S2_AERVE|nr:MATE family efflux transporter [Aeromonas veronii]MBA2797863.1 MATE family efflux transporter [Aeromonas veronii]PTH80762.1 MATE family efflux transporter [Aeromonas veronii]RDE64537.1 MATE family efflux transporter [Aeromonas veronii]UJP35408.1 MATE family efflux transporter [Aeromonas veronii]HDO1373377.1 MATE family efflux transporter [Aeromonas veronii]